MIRAYHFVGTTLRDGRPVPPDGEWLEHTGPLVMCESGLHASVDPFDALKYAPGPILCLVDVDGETLTGSDKVVARRRRIIRRADLTPQLRQFARECALSVMHLWDAPSVVRDYLTTDDELLRAAAGATARAAARDAAWDATWDARAARAAGVAGAAPWAAWAAAWAAAWDATWAAARDAARAAGVAGAEQRARFGVLVAAALREAR